MGSAAVGRKNLEISHAKQRAAITCQRGHPFPPWNGVKRRCKICHGDSAKRNRFNGNVKEETLLAAVEALRKGAPPTWLAGIQNGKYTPGTRIVHPKRLRAYCERNPEVGAPILKMMDANSARALSEVRALGRIANRIIWRVKKPQTIDGIARSSIADSIAAAVAKMPAHIREDVSQSLWVAVLEHRLDPNEILKKAREFAAVHNRMFSKFVPVIGGLMRSTDQRVYDDGTTTLGDTVARGLWDDS